jgi:hypothetical protein
MQTPEDKQGSFLDWAIAQRTVRNEVLEKINVLVDLKEAEQCLEATYSTLGRPAHRAAVMLRVMLLQQYRRVRYLGIERFRKYCGHYWMVEARRAAGN